MEITLKVITIPEERGGRIIFNAEVATDEGGEAAVAIKGLKFNRAKGTVEFPQHRSKNYSGETAGLSEPLRYLIGDLLKAASKKFHGHSIPPIKITPAMLRRYTGHDKEEAITAESLMK